jgi:hypothetical protein
MIIAAVTAMGLASGVAYAEDDGPAANTQSTEISGLVAQAPTEKVPSHADTQSGHGPWLFPPIGKYLDQRAGG